MSQIQGVGGRGRRTEPATPAVAAFLFVLFLVPLWLYRATFLVNWDSVQYALGVDDFDLGAHQPHPPGYIGYEWLGGLVAHLTGDVPAALTLMSVVSGALAPALLYVLARRMLPARYALAAALLFGFSPLLWHYSGVALTYAPEVALSLPFVLLAHRAGREAKLADLLGAAACFALLGSVRQSAILMLAPLWPLALRPFPRRAKVGATALLVAGCLAWTIPLMWASGGPIAYVREARDLADLAVARTAFVTASFTGVLQNVGIFGIALLIGMHANLLVLRPAHRRPGGSLGALSEADRRFLLTWVIVPVLFFILIHTGQPGYALLILPAGYLWVGSSLAQVVRHPRAGRESSAPRLSGDVAVGSVASGSALEGLPAADAVRGPAGAGCGGPATATGGPASAMGGPTDAMGGPATAMRGPAGAGGGGPATAMGGPAGATGGPASAMGGPTDAMGGPATAMGGPADPLGGPATAMAGPTDAMAGPTGAMGGPTGAMGGPATAMGGPADAAPRPAGAVGGPTGAARGQAHAVGGPAVAARVPAVALRGPSAGALFWPRPAAAPLWRRVGILAAAGIATLVLLPELTYRIASSELGAELQQAAGLRSPADLTAAYVTDAPGQSPLATAVRQYSIPRSDTYWSEVIELVSSYPAGTSAVLTSIGGPIASGSFRHLGYYLPSYQVYGIGWARDGSFGYLFHTRNRESNYSVHGMAESAGTLRLPRDVERLIVPDADLAGLLDPSFETEHRSLGGGAMVTLVEVSGGSVLELSNVGEHALIRLRQEFTDSEEGGEGSRAASEPEAPSPAAARSDTATP